MNCCINCFSDQGLKSRIIAESKEIGDCDFCGSNQLSIISSAALAEVFEPIFDLYINFPNVLYSL